MSKPRFKAGDQVYDRWWSWRSGRVVATLKTVVKVKWCDGTQDSYDRAHAQFLELETQRSK